MRNVLKSALSSWICNFCTAMSDNITTSFKFMLFSNGSHGIPFGEHGLWLNCEWIGGNYVHKSLPLELSGWVTFRVYIPINKAHFQVGRTLWLSWSIWLTRNREITSSIFVLLICRTVYAAALICFFCYMCAAWLMGIRLAAGKFYWLIIWDLKTLSKTSDWYFIVL
jgi:hypothetical protein